jgi:hypothetical protein
MTTALEIAQSCRRAADRDAKARALKLAVGGSIGIDPRSKETASRRILRKLRSWSGRS